MLRRLFGDETDLPLDQIQEKLLTGWGRTAPTRAGVIRPSNDEIISRLLTDSSPRGVIARGLGRSYGDPAQNAGGVVIDMTSRAAVHDFDIPNATITVDAGISLADLADRIIPFGFFLPVTPGTQFVTVGGAIACDVHGKSHHADGSFAEHVLAMTLLTPSGELLELTPEGTPEYFWATAGGMGLTGVILTATLRLPRIETAVYVVDTDRTKDLDEVMRLQSEEDVRYRYSVAWVDCIATGAHLGRSVLTRGNHATLADLSSPKEARLNRKTPPGIPTPPWAPTGLIRQSTLRLFNEAWYRKSPAHERQAIQTVDAFFYPLDMLTGWNRMYGSSGFIQYQFVVPFERDDVIRRVVETLATERWPTSLTVLKRMGPGRGYMSFPIPGWTLALDFPAATPGLAGLLERFDRTVLEAGGRVYLAKDSRLRPEIVPLMYPSIDRWREVLAILDPEQRMQSDMARRLRLREVE